MLYPFIFCTAYPTQGHRDGVGLPAGGCQSVAGYDHTHSHTYSHNTDNLRCLSAYKACPWTGKGNQSAYKKISEAKEAHAFHPHGEGWN